MIEVEELFVQCECGKVHKVVIDEEGMRVFMNYSFNDPQEKERFERGRRDIEK